VGCLLSFGSLKGFEHGDTDVGITYSGQWTSMFASMSTDIGSDLPLWAVQDDFKPGVATTTRFMGGWTKAFAKQYNLGEFVYEIVGWLGVGENMGG